MVGGEGAGATARWPAGCGRGGALPLLILSPLPSPPSPHPQPRPRVPRRQATRRETPRPPRRRAVRSGAGGWGQVSEETGGKKKKRRCGPPRSPPPSLARSRPRPYLVRPGGRRVVEAIVRIIRVRPVAHVEAGGGGGQLAVAGWGRGRGRGGLVVLGLALGQGLKHVFGGDAAHGGQRAGVSGCRWVCGGWPEWAGRPGNALGTGGGRPRLARATGEKKRAAAD